MSISAATLRFLFFGCCVCLGWNNTLGAAVVLAMDDAVEQALATDTQLAAIRAARAVARFRAAAARVLPQPEFRFTANGLSFDPDGGDVRNSIAWRWSPPRPREFSLKARLAETGTRIADVDAQAAEGKLAATVRHAYRRAVVAAERARLARQSTELRRQMLDTAKRQVENGLKELVDADLAAISLGDAELLQLRADLSAKREKGELLKLTGIAAATTEPELSPLALELPAGDKAALLDRALTRRAELSQTAAACDAARTRIDMARNERYPWISSAQFTRRVGVDASRSPWGFQIGISLPLFRTPASAEARIDQSELERCRLEQKSWQARIRREVETALVQWEAAMAELRKIDELRHGPAERAIESVRAALAAGRAERMDLLQAQARKLSLEDRWLERRFDLAALEMQLEVATAF